MTEKSLTVSNYMRSPEVRERFTEVLGHEAGAYISSVLIAVAQNERLQDCSLQSIYAAALRSATLKLSVDPGLGQAYLVPFKTECTLIIGYRGLINLAQRTGRYRYINVAPIYQGETVTEDRLTGMLTLGGACLEKTVIGWIASFESITGFAKAIYMTTEEIHEHAKRYSRGYERADSAWKTHTHMMERKTVLRCLLSEWGYLDPSYTEFLKDDNGEADPITVDAPIVTVSASPEVARRSEEEIITDLGFPPDPKDKAVTAVSTTPAASKPGKYGEFDELAKTDPATAFWKLCKAEKVPDLDGLGIVSSSKADMTVAYIALRKHINQINC